MTISVDSPAAAPLDARVLAFAREWVADAYELDVDEVSELSDTRVFAIVERDYEGGWSQLSEDEEVTVMVVRESAIVSTEITGGSVRHIHGRARSYSVIPWGGVYALRVMDAGGEPIALGDWSELLKRAGEVESEFIAEGLANGTLVEDMWCAGRYEVVA